MDEFGGLWQNHFRERVATPPRVNEKLPGSTLVEVEIVTMPASFDDCFEHAQLEYFHGRPHALQGSRAARHQSLEANGHHIPQDDFATTHSIETEARRHLQSSTCSDSCQHASDNDCDDGEVGCRCR